MEVNPDHHVTKELREHWQKVAGLVMWKAGLQKVTLTVQELEMFACLPKASMPTIIVHTHEDSLDVLLMPLDEAKRYAAKQGVSL